ncbi:MAG: M28 family peptidase [Clostridia bacterium]|nr:M28 family peptidase [Clostridia bacterium]
MSEVSINVPENLSESKKQLSEQIKFFKEVSVNNPVRMTRKQKNKFIRDFIQLGSDMGYKVTLEEGIIAHNIVVQGWEDDVSEIDKIEWVSNQLDKIEQLGVVRKLTNPKQLKNYITNHFTGSTESKKSDISKDDGIEFLIGAHYDTPPRMFKQAIKHPFLVIGSAYTVGLASAYVINCLACQSLNESDFLFVNKLIQDTVNILNVSSMGYLFGLMGKVTANPSNILDNDSGVVGILQLMEKYKDAPKHIKDKIKFVCFDGEERFMNGSLAYVARHRAKLKGQTYINLDCIGLGKDMNLFHFNYIKGAPSIAKELFKAFKKDGKFNPVIRKNGVLTLSDHMSFNGSASESVCILANDNDTNSLTDRIHTKNDVIVNPDNINAVVNTVAQVVDDRILNKTVLLEEEQAEVNTLVFSKKKSLQIGKTPFVIPATPIKIASEFDIDSKTFDI